MAGIALGSDQAVTGDRRRSALSPVLSHIQAAELLAARSIGAGEMAVSIDLGLTRSSVRIHDDSVALPDGQQIEWEAIKEIARSEATCFAVEGGALHRIQYFSEATHRMYSLMATAGAPTMLIAGFPMHRIKGIDPYEDTRRKVATIAPIHGRVLDTTTGLGYTAIHAARTADDVVTIELDPTALEVARRNPWSRELFENPGIVQRIGDSYEVVPQLESGSFSAIFHDPPTFKLAGQLYSEAFYRELHRVLRRGGRLFHYLGDLNSPLGSTVARGAIKRLQSAGFTRVTRRPEAFGVSATR